MNNISIVIQQVVTYHDDSQIINEVGLGYIFNNKFVNSYTNHNKFDTFQLHLDKLTLKLIKSKSHTTKSIQLTYKII